jgi:DNA-binding MarR family transcriptional regulator
LRLQLSSRIFGIIGDVPETLSTPKSVAKPPNLAVADPPRWLSAEEQAVWRSFISATQMLLDRLDQELTRDSGIGHGYYEVLVRLSEVPDRRMRMSELADRSLSSRSRLSHAVARLEEQGWVRRESCPTDRRGQLAVLTDAGFAALAAAAPAHVEGVRTHLFDALTPEQVVQLGQISKAVVDGLSAACVETACARGAAAER